MNDQTHDLLSEDTIRIEEAAAIARTHFSTCYRWILKGVPRPNGERVRLEAVRLGRAWVTSRQALERFSAALTPDIDRGEKATIRPAGRRRRASEQAAATLERVHGF